MSQLEGTRTAIQALSDAMDMAEGYPSRGVDVGGGRHIEGWTMTHGRVEKHPSQDLYAYRVTPEVVRRRGEVVRVDGRDVTITDDGAKARESSWDPEVLG